MSKSSRASQNNRSNQMNPNNAAYHSSREGNAQSGSPSPAVEPTPPQSSGTDAGSISKK